jgi:hypothetical protein
MSRQVFFTSREDKYSARSDIFSGLSGCCFEKEKHAFTFQNNVNTLVRGVEGGLASDGTVSVRCFRAATAFSRASENEAVSHRPVVKGDRSIFPFA